MRSWLAVVGLIGASITASGCATSSIYSAGPTPATPSDAQLCPGAVEWSQAASVNGQYATVTGSLMSAVYEGASDGQPTFLNMGDDYPNKSRVTVVIWGEYRSRFAMGGPEHEYTQGDRLCVTGSVGVYQGIPQIEVKSPDQICIAVNVVPSPPAIKVCLAPSPRIVTTTTTTPSPTTTAAAIPPTTLPPTPTGTMLVEGPGPSDASGTLGQSGGHDSACSNWELNFMNNSDTEIVGVTFAPPAASYRDLSSSTVLGQAQPPVVQLNVSIPAHSSQIQTFSTCTVTPQPPTSQFPDYAVFAVTKPASMPFQWITGAGGTASWTY